MKAEITKIPNLTTNGFVKTSSSDGTLSVDTNSYGTGTVTSVATGTGLTGGTITATGTVELNTKLAPMDSLAGNSLKFLRVNAGETAVEYATSGGGGTVTSVSVTTANGVSGTVATDTTTPAISLTLGAITPTSVNSVVVSGSSTPTLAVTGTTAVSGTNTGNETVNTIGTLINGASSATPNDADLVMSVDTSVAKKNTWTQIKAFLKTYFDTLYQPLSSVVKFPITKSWDGQGAGVTTGNTRFFTAPYAMTITGWNISAVGTSPTCTIDIWKIATGTALPTVSNTIMGTKPALSSGNAVRSSTMTGWTTLAIAAGDILGFNIDASANGTVINFELEVS